MNNCCQILQRDDYEVLNYVQEGALGKVYYGRCRSTGLMVALKFFGYTKRRPSSRLINREIKNLNLVKGVEGIVQMEGVFYDPPEGILGNKIHRREYPVIVMEWFEGGALFDRIHKLQSMSEKSLAMIFRSTIQALENLHRRNMIHRDIKLENLMLVSNADNSPIKIIDLGLSIQLPEGSEVYIDNGLYGTAGLYAPESVLYSHYSKKTDLWQAGCALYSLLSGLLPFNPKYPEDIVNYTHYEMSGSCWDSISSHGKNLISNLLQKDSYLRYSSQETLNHCWIVNAAPETILDPSYFQRIQRLKLKNKLKQFFLSNDLKQQNKQKRQKLQKLFPYLFPPFETTTASSSSSLSCKQSSCPSPSSSQPSQPAQPSQPLSSSSSHHHRHNSLTLDISSSLEHNNCDQSSSLWMESAEEALQYENTRQNYEKFLNFQIKIRTMKELALRSYFQKPSSDRTPTSSAPTSPRLPVLNSSSSQPNEMTYGDFVSVLLKCHIPEFAQPEIFSIFDNNNSGTIDIKEFLFTMLAFKQLPSHDNHNTHNTHNNRDNVNDNDNDTNQGRKDTTLSHFIEQSDDINTLSERESEALDLSLHTRELKNEECGLEDEDDLESRLFFSVFDLDDSGSIDIQELEFIIRCLLTDDENSSTAHENESPSSCCSSTSSSFFSTSSSNNVLFSSSSQPAVPISSVSSSSPSSSSTSTASSNAFQSKIPALLLAFDSESSDSNQPPPPPPPPPSSQPSSCHQTITSSPSIGELFDVMDVSKNGEVDYSEFKVFYQSIISPSTTPRSPITREGI